MERTGTARRSDSSVSTPIQPAIRQVGFRVEGVPQSPAQEPTLLHDLGGNAVSPSPNPVIIPPSFQAESPISGTTSLQRQQTMPAKVPPGVPEEAQSLATQLPAPSASAQQPHLLGSHSLPQYSESGMADFRKSLQGLQPAAGTTGSRQPLQESVAEDHNEGLSSPPTRMASDELPSPRAPSAVRDSSAGSSGAMPQSSEASPGLAGAMSDLGPHADPLPEIRQRSQRSSPAEPPTPAPSPATGPAASLPASSFMQYAHHQPPSLMRHSTSGVGRSSPTQAAVKQPSPSTSTVSSFAGSPGLQQKSKPAPIHQERRSQPEPLQQKQQQQPDAKQSKPEQGKGQQDKGKPTSKAERRALQEKQRAEKAAAKAEGDHRSKASSRAATAAPPREAMLSPFRNAPGQREDQQQPAGRQVSRPPGKQAKGAKASDSRADVTPAPHSVEMFAHLPPYRAVSLDKLLLESEAASKVHPAVLRLGLKYVDGGITGGNARCLGMMVAFCRLIEDYKTPDGKVLSRDLASQLNTAIQFLVECRPLSVSMGNAIKFLKLQVSKVDPSTPEVDAKAQLVDKIKRFVDEKIVFANSMVVTNAVTKIEAGDVILTYGFSSVVFNIMLRAHKEGVKFRTIVVDARPHWEGRQLLRKLLHHGISASYCLLNTLSYVIQEATKTVLGASAVMSNGTVISRAGTAAVAMVSEGAGRPVLICCETYKFAERVQLDSITANELGNPLALLAGPPARLASSPLAGWKELPQLGLLNVTYDAMPAELVTLIVTEFGAIPPTSVPVILREYRQEPPL